MTATSLDPAHVIADEDALRALFPPTHDLAVQKVLKTLDPHSLELIARCPFVCLGTQNADGKADVSPRGDPAGFVQVLDPQTIAIPDRPGNNRLDSLSNILANPHVGLLFIIPGFDETLRINGRATLTTDPTLLAKMAVQGREPKLAIVIAIDTIFLHCAKAFRRSKLWDPSTFQDRKEMPSLVQIVLEQMTGRKTAPELQKTLDDDLEEAYRTTMY